MSDIPESPARGATTRDYDLEPTLDVSEPRRMKALGDPLRLQICDLVLERAMSVTELAELVDRPKGSVAYHVDVLVDAGLLRVVRTRQVRSSRNGCTGGRHSPTCRPAPPASSRSCGR
ncbi:MAG: helix-turn-helix domain-containing protein [Ilumatobacteraceae bacterium]